MDAHKVLEKEDLHDDAFGAGEGSGAGADKGDVVMAVAHVGAWLGVFQCRSVDLQRVHVDGRKAAAGRGQFCRGAVS